MQIIYPGDYFSARQVEESYASEAELCRQHGFAVNTFESMTNPGTARLEASQKILYRGWMLSREDYSSFEAAAIRQSATLVTTSEQYLSAHYLPRWYPLLADYTPETVIIENERIEDAIDIVQGLCWSQFFVKDFVKSLKTAGGSVIRSAEELPHLIAQMQNFRGAIEGGLCIRRFEAFIPETEIRYFAVGGRGFAPSEGEAIPEVVAIAAERIESPFFSVDIAKREDGTLRIVEIGDGQVSDTTGWDMNRFVNLILKRLETEFLRVPKTDIDSG
ncbi:ATP-grasp domain-containing protein [Roseofilum casamattae]|uniref:ATP-grasp domain-containing protein n=1 Tax=Roseofilum casamattae BLCC-M143 TaxID=3022442 RepID=A0ABT7BUD0_9CYAN|nr:ATP-grasp domain-containing protein [Roseofilum casamattae]MDJ1182793.1 ATP-grasp domain-containing protein [Roseofilum casamattae BLCC-M143]